MKFSTMILLMSVVVAATAFVLMDDSDYSDADIKGDITDMLKNDLKADGYTDSTGTITVSEREDSEKHGLNIYEVRIITKDSSKFHTINKAGINNFLSTYRTYVCQITLEGDFDYIGNYTFAGFSALTKFETFSGTKPIEIGVMAFKNCTVMDTFRAKLSSVGTEAFANCPNLDIFNDCNISVNGNIGKEAFSGCRHLLTITIGDGCTSIGDNAFQGCSSLMISPLSNMVLGSVGDRAFSGCENITDISITVRDGELRIGKDAFRNSGLRTINIEEGAKGEASSMILGDGAFSECDYLRSANFHRVIVTVGINSFYGCTSLSSWESYLGPDATIPRTAFAACGNLSSVTFNVSAAIGSSFKFIVETNAYQSCDALATFTISGSSVCELTLSDNCFRNCTSLTVISLPAKSFVNASVYTFSGLSALTSICDTYSDSPIKFTSEAPYAFSGCTALASVRLEGSEIYPHMFEGSGIQKIPVMTATTIYVGERAFANCASLSSFIFSGYVHFKGTYTFMNCTSLTLASFKLVSDGNCYSLPDGTFSGCNVLEELNIDNHTHDIEFATGDFASCTNLSILRLENTPVATFSSNVFSASGKLTSISVTGGTGIKVHENAFRNQSGLEYIGSDLPVFGIDANYAFAGCLKLKSVILSAPEHNDLVVFESMFEGSGVSKVTLTESTIIKQKAFSGCDKLTDLIFKANVEEMGANAFAGCILLENLELPFSDISGGVNAFSGCTSLTNVVLKSSESSVFLLPEGLFYGCTSLYSVITEHLGVSKDPTYIFSSGVFQGCSKLETISITKADYAQAYFSDGVFNGCESLTTISTVSVANTPYTITKNAVRGLPSFVGFKSSYGHDEVVAIDGDGDYVFSGCLALRSVHLNLDRIFDNMFENSGIEKAPVLKGDEVTIGQSAFANCAKLKSFCPEYKVVLDGNSIFSGCSALEDIELRLMKKSDDSGHSIPVGTFAGCASLKRATIDSGTDKMMLGTESFGSCPSLSYILITNAPLVTIGSNVFSGESSLKEFRVDAGCQIVVQKDAFRNQTSLAGLYNGKTGTEDARVAGDNAQFAFYGCTNLVKVNLYAKEGETVTVAQSMFESSGLTTFDISNKVKIEERAFANCSKLEFISQEIRGSIANSCFESCAALKAVALDLDSSGLYENVFAGCTNLIAVQIKCVDPVLSEGFFSGCINLADVTIVLPEDYRGTVVFHADTFRNCSKLATLKFTGKQVSLTLGDNTFSGCESLALIELPDQKAATSIVTITNTSIRNLPALTLIGDSAGNSALIKISTDGMYAFAGCTSLKNVRLDVTVFSEHMFEGSGLVSAPVNPNDKVTIHQNAFANCSKMREFKPTYQVQFDGISIFAGCSLLEDISLKLVQRTDGNDQTIPNGTFTGCSSLKTATISLSNSNGRLDSGIFSTCPVLEKVNITATKKVTVYANVFSGEGALREFVVENDATVVVQENSFRNQVSLVGIKDLGSDNAPVSFTDAKYAFYGCTNLNSIRIHFEDQSAANAISESMFEGSGLQYLDADGTIFILDRAFANCTQLTTVSSKMIVSKMSPGAFTGCTALKQIRINVRNISDAVDGFSGCTKLEEVTLLADSGSRIVLPYGFFSGCTYLKSLYIDGDCLVEKNVFNGCDRLDVIQVSDKGIGIKSQALAGASNLEHIYRVNSHVPAKIIVYGSTDYAFYGCSKLKEAFVSYENGSAAIGSYMFYNCQELSSVVFDAAIAWKGIGAYAFSGCSFLSAIVCSDGKTLTLSEDVVIAQNALSGCGSLEYLEFISEGRTVTFQNNCMANDSVLQRISVKGAESIIIDEHSIYNCPALSELVFEASRSGTSAIFGDSSLTDIVNLKSIKAPNMTLSVGARAMENLVHLSEIQCKGISHVGDYAFYNCNILKHVTLDSSIDNIGNYAFARCSELEMSQMPLPNLKAIGKFSFSNCSKIFSLDLSESKIVEIGEGSFSSCSALLDVKLPATVRTIDRNAFEECSKLANVNISELANLETIGESAFKSTRISTVEFPAELVTVGKEAFAGCQRLETVVFDAKLETIGESAFYECSMLKTLNLPKSIKSIGDSAFRGCAALEGVDLRVIPALEHIPNRVFSDCSKLEYVLLPEGVKTIGDWAFAKCVRLNYIDFNEENQVTSLGSGAFSECSMIVSMEFPNLKHIGQQVFSGCTALYSLTLSDSLEEGSEIGSYMFSGCETLGSFIVPENVVSLGEQAFAGCLSLRAVALPATLNSIGTAAFSQCYSLTEVYGDGCVIKQIGSDVFNGCVKLESLDLDLECTLPAKAFEGCVSLISLDLSGCIGSIPESFAKGCIALNTVILPEDCTSIGEHAFDGCLNMTIPIVNGFEGDITIGSYAFYGCVSLGTFPGCKVISLGEHAFDGCSELDFSMVTMDMAEVPAYTFAGCEKLNYIYTQAESYGPHAYEGAGLSSETVLQLKNVRVVSEYAFCDTINTMFGIGGEVRTIGDHAFENSGFDGVLTAEYLATIGDYAFAGTSMTSLLVTDHNSMGLTIGEFAFAGCHELTSAKFVLYRLNSVSPSAFDDCPKLEHVDFGSSLTEYNGALYLPDMTVLFKVISHIQGNYAIHPDTLSISPYAFRGCTEMTSLSNTEKLRSIGEYAFEGCTSLTTLDLPNISELGEYAFSDSGIREIRMPALAVIPDGLFKGCRNLDSSAILANARIIGDHAFEGCTSISRLELSGITTVLGDYCFKDCSALKGSLTVPSGILVLGEGVFKGCMGLEEVTISRSGSIPDSMFEGCTSLKNVTMPSSVTSIGESAFKGCTALESISVPNRVDSIGEEAFAECTSLAYILLPERLGCICAGLFRGCTALEYIEVPQSVTEIGDNAFAGCSSLIYIGLSSKVRSIGEYAFDGCSDLQDIELPSGLSIIGKAAFRDCSSLTVVQIPSIVSVIPDEAFMGCTSLSGVVLHQNVLAIGERAFSGDGRLSAISGTDGLVTVGMLAFENCRMMQSFSISRNMAELSVDAFAGCTALSVIYVDADNRNFSTDGTAVYINKADQPKILLKVLPDAMPAEITVPVTVTEVSPLAIYNLAAVTEVKFLGNIETIGERNFELCPRLSSIVISSGNYHMMGSALVDKDETRILAISGTDKLIIPASVKFIEAGAFLNMGKASEVVVDANNTEFELKDGAIVSKDGSKLYRVLNVGDILTIHSGVKTVCTYAIADLGINRLSVSDAAIFETESVYHCTSLRSMSIGSKDVIFCDSSLSAGTSDNPVTIHIESADGYKVPSEAFGRFTKASYTPVGPEDKDAEIDFVIPAVALVALVAVFGVGVFVFRRN